MDFDHSAEHEVLRSAIRDFLSRHAPTSEARRLMDDEQGYEAAVWKQMADQLMLHGLSIPEEYGGAGYSNVELAIAFYEMGRVLYSGPFFATIGLAAPALLAAGDESAKRDYLPGLANGTSIATLAFAEDSAEQGLDSIRTSAVRSADGWRISGHKSYVVDGRSADLVLIVSQFEEGLALFAVDREAAGLTVTSLTTLDLTRRLARLELTDTPARLVSGPSDASSRLACAMDTTRAMLANEEVGGASACLEMATEYSKTRKQFGRPIGSFQAIKHKCADLFVALESSKLAADYAALAATADPDELPAAAAIASWYCADAFMRAAEENIQIHGGIGFTWEHDAHLYLRRAKSSQLLFGPSQYHLSRLADMIGI
jgi:alkylation response protein AidB-like acyl-CoA dehydrogenase